MARLFPLVLVVERYFQLMLDIAAVNQSINGSLNSLVIVGYSYQVLFYV
jgi:hypothetical protein